MKLEQIKYLMTEARQRLATLKPGPGNIDEIAKARLLEREKLHLLAEQETTELKRIADKKAANRDKMRSTLTKEIEREAKAILDEDNQHMKAIEIATHTLVKALAARHSLFDPARIGLLSKDAMDCFTSDEHQQFAAAITKSCQPVRIGEFAAVIREALAGAPSDARDTIRRLFATPPHMLGMPADKPPQARKSVPLIDIAQALHGTPYPTPVEADTPDVVDNEPITGARFAVDLRPTANRGDGPKMTREISSIKVTSKPAPVHQIVDLRNTDNQPPVYEVP